MSENDHNGKEEGLTIAGRNRLLELSRQRRALMALPAEEALSTLLETPQPEALVHSYPAEDLYYFINEIGLSDALPVLALASDNQLDHILDMETWNKDQLDVTAVEDWIAMILKADKGRATRWLLEKNPDLLVYYLLKAARIVMRNHDEDPSDLGENLITVDDTFYLQAASLAVEENEETVADRQVFLSELLHRISSYDYIAYQKILLETQAVIPAEFEEEALRWRNVRLAEKGILPWEEAMDVYRPQTAAGMAASRLPEEKSPEQKEALFPVPQYATEALADDVLFVKALKHPKNADIQDRLQVEFAALNNRIIVADRKKVKERDGLNAVVKKTCGYLTIGLEMLAESSGTNQATAAAVKNIRNYPLVDIFRLAFGSVLDLRKRAESWRRNSWFERQGLRLTFWGEQWVGVIGGLLLEKPLYFDNYRNGTLYREFSSASEIRLTADVLDRIIAVDDLLSRLPVFVDKPFSTHGPMDYKNYLLTNWARHDLNLQPPFRPLSMREFTLFFSSLWENDVPPRTIRDSAREFFLSWLSGQSGTESRTIQEELGSVLESMFLEILNEFGRVKTDDLDPRYIQLFLIRK